MSTKYDFKKSFEFRVLERVNFLLKGVNPRRLSHCTAVKELCTQNVLRNEFASFEANKTDGSLSDSAKFVTTIRNNKKSFNKNKHALNQAKIALKSNFREESTLENLATFIALIVFYGEATNLEQSAVPKNLTSKIREKRRNNYQDSKTDDNKTIQMFKSAVMIQSLIRRKQVRLPEKQENIFHLNQDEGDELDSWEDF